MSSETVTLVSQDEKQHLVNREAAIDISDFLRDALDENDEENTVVQVLRVKDAALKKVVEFVEHYKQEKMAEIPTPLGASNFQDIVTQEFYREFLPEEKVPVFELLSAANYMGIKPLLDLTCLKVTFMLSGKSAEEIRVILNLPKMTPEEESKLREEHKWIFEDS